jgi:hypothetical protein
VKVSGATRVAALLSAGVLGGMLMVGYGGVLPHRTQSSTVDSTTYAKTTCTSSPTTINR